MFPFFFLILRVLPFQIPFLYLSLGVLPFYHLSQLRFVDHLLGVLPFFFSPFSDTFGLPLFHFFNCLGVYRIYQQYLLIIMLRNEGPKL